jgi:hypothetical protein
MNSKHITSYFYFFLVKKFKKVKTQYTNEINLQSKTITFHK